MFDDVYTCSCHLGFHKGDGVRGRGGGQGYIIVCLSTPLVHLVYSQQASPISPIQHGT